MQRVGLETILGLQVEGNQLSIAPHIPSMWSEYEIDFLWKETKYQIRIINPDHISYGAVSMTLDGIAIDLGQPILMEDDKNTHAVICRIVKI
ncbi:glycosyl hydrolase family 65 protein [Acetobacter ghanensis]